MKIISERKKDIMERLDAMLEAVERADRSPVKIHLTEGEALSFVELLPTNHVARYDLPILGIRRTKLSYRCIPIEIVD